MYKIHQKWLFITLESVSRVDTRKYSEAFNHDIWHSLYNILYKVHQKLLSLLLEIFEESLVDDEFKLYIEYLKLHDRLSPENFIDVYGIQNVMKVLIYEIFYSNYKCDSKVMYLIECCSKLCISICVSFINIFHYEDSCIFKVPNPEFEKIGGYYDHIWNFVGKFTIGLSSSLSLEFTKIDHSFARVVLNKCYKDHFLEIVNPSWTTNWNFFAKIFNLVLFVILFLKKFIKNSKLNIEIWKQGIARIVRIIRIMV